MQGGYRGLAGQGLDGCRVWRFMCSEALRRIVSEVRNLDSKAGGGLVCKAGTGL